jgi:hypothetical protein
MYFIAILLFIAYSATFISSLAVSRPQLPFSTFEDLLADERFHIGVRAESSHEDYFKARKSYGWLRDVRPRGHGSSLVRVKNISFSMSSTQSPIQWVSEAISRAKAAGP